MVEVPWPLSNNPGLKPQEGTGRLINVFAEPRGDGTPVWRRAPGALVFARAPSSGSASLEIIANARGATLFSTFFEFLGSSTFQYAAGSTTEIAYPSQIQANDLIFIASVMDEQTTAWSSPAGFTSLIASATGGAFGYSLYYKVSTGETTVALASPTTSSAGVSLVWGIRGADSTTPVCDTTTSVVSTAGNPNPPDLGLTTADALVMAVGFLDDDTITGCTAPSSFGHPLFSVTTSSAADTGASVMVAFAPVASTGTVGCSSFATDGTDDNAAVTFALRHD